VSRLARFGLTEFDDAARGGVEVRRVRDRSPAAQLGFEPGLVLREINGTDVASREEFLRSLAQMMLADRASFVRVSAVDPRQDEEIEGLRIILGD
jgi:S1-C subfamily serine protease